MKRLLLTLLVCCVMLGTAFAQFGAITRGPLSGNCSGPQFGLDTVNNQLYICSNSGSSNFQWVAVGTNAGSSLPIGSVGQTLFNVDGSRTYAPTSNVLFDGSGNLIQLTALTWSIDSTGLAIFNSIKTIPDGVHAGQIGLSGNTTNSTINANTAYIFGPTQAAFSGFLLFQMPSAALPIATALCVNSSSILSYCTSVVGSDGTCTCH